jgi:enoyl-CoA hydratase/carnithine racemase
MSPRVIVEDAAGVRVLTLNRPEARNALDGALISALYEALAAERAAAAEHRPDLARLEQRRAAVTERNRRQVRAGP